MTIEASLSPPQVSAARLTKARSQALAWFRAKGWSPFRFQKEVWDAYLAGRSGLIHATTGTGKTYAAWMGPLIEGLAEQSKAPAADSRKKPPETPLRLLWITPLRALASDTAESLIRPMLDLGLPWSLETRTGDTSSSVRNRQRNRLPTVLVTTPESLSLLLTRPDAREQFRDLRAVVVDEWHELLSTKRGVQLELALARLRRWNCETADSAAGTSPLRTWGLSATLGNLPQALDVLVGLPEPKGPVPQIVEGRQRKKIVIDSAIPPNIERFPWAGHLGLRLLPEVVQAIDSAESTLIFTNTRSQTEIWYQAILRARPDWAGRLALHHGSLDQGTRSWVEDGLRHGRLKGVVCTSSLDLGVDFSPVDRVIQIGSPKGVARLLQRAGRSGHDPTRDSRVTCVPTNALELIEAAAVRDAIQTGHIESRTPHDRPLDVLCQHAVTIAVGGGFRPEELHDEVRTAASYRDLTRDEWDWVLDFVTRGGPALRAYPDYHKVVVRDGIHVVDNDRIARLHRMSIGTISSDASLTVQFLNGPKIGMVEESFLSKLAPGDRFTLGGRVVELVFIRDMKVWVRKASGTETGRVPRWMGGRLPLSTELAHALRRKLEEAASGEFRGPEMAAVRPLLEVQQRWSHIPRANDLLIEQTKSREGYHIFVYPFAGRLVHEGLAALFAWRIAQQAPITFSMSANDYGFELVSPTLAPLQQAIDHGLFSTDDLGRDIALCLNSVEMGKRQFREIARIAGLVFTGFPGAQKTARQLQASTGLLYDVFSNYDPGNLLLDQARREVLERQLEQTRLIETLKEMQRARLLLTRCERFTPLSFPLMVDRLRDRLSSEKLSDRVRRMQQALEAAADKKE
jgi:ATP-dependent Lhr-like helicase